MSDAEPQDEAPNFRDLAEALAKLLDQELGPIFKGHLDAFAEALDLADAELILAMMHARNFPRALGSKEPAEKAARQLARGWRHKVEIDGSIERRIIALQRKLRRDGEAFELPDTPGRIYGSPADLINELPIEDAARLAHLASRLPGREYKDDGRPGVIAACRHLLAFWRSIGQSDAIYSHGEPAANVKYAKDFYSPALRFLEACLTAIGEPNAGAYIEKHRRRLVRSRTVRNA